MKKYIALILILILCISLCACGKSKEVIAYEDFAGKVGVVSLDSGDAIAAAENAYVALTEEEKAFVAESYSILSEKRKEYDKLVSVVALIDSIGNVTLESEADIVAAETAYAELSADEKAKLTEAAEKLNSYRNTYDQALEAQRAANAAKATNAITAIGTVSLDSKDAVQEARMLYDALTAEEKKLVSSYSLLETAENEFNALWEAEKQRVIKEYSKKFDIESDPIEGISWYTHVNTPYYIDTRCYIIPYIGMRGDTPWICIRYNYTGDSWIFWESMTIMVDGQKYYKAPGYYNTTRDNDTEVWEYYDEALTYGQAMDTEELQMLKAIADSNETIIRFQGDDYHHDLYVSSKDKQIIRDTLVLYEAMLG